jgi:hypothetical protein
MCRDRVMLAGRYHADLRVYSEAEQSLERAIGANFPAALQRADRARIAFEKARDQLNRHIGWHHCLADTELIWANPAPDD